MQCSKKVIASLLFAIQYMRVNLTPSMGSKVQWRKEKTGHYSKSKDVLVCISKFWQIFDRVLDPYYHIIHWELYLLGWWLEIKGWMNHTYIVFVFFLFSMKLFINAFIFFYLGKLFFRKQKFGNQIFEIFSVSEFKKWKVHRDFNFWVFKR